MGTKKCKYCQTGKAVVEKLNCYTGKIKIHKNFLNTQIKDDNNYGWASIAYSIKYCPWCGGALAGSDKHEITAKSSGFN